MVITLCGVFGFGIPDMKPEMDLAATDPRGRKLISFCNHGSKVLQAIWQEISIT
jgi:hypothetical protein